MSRAWISVLSVAALAFAASAQSPDQRKTQTGQEQSKPASSSKQSQQQSGAQTGASASASASTSASVSAGQNSGSLSSGTTVNADLATTLDARKCHPGQSVVAKTTRDVKEDGRVVLRKGTRLIGHVTEAQAKTKENAESSLGIVFDEAVMKNGSSIPFHATIQALAQAQSAAAMSDGDLMSSGEAMGSAGAMGSGGSGGGLLGSAGSAVGSTADMAGSTTSSLGQTAGGALRSTSGAAASSAGAIGGLNVAGELTSNSSGLFGLRGINLSSTASNSAEGTLITSATGTVHLASGTQMVLRMTGR